MTLKGPLSGVRIVDITIAAAGPYGVATLASLGADVIRIEPPMIGEVGRLAGTTGRAQIIHCNKKGVVLDLWSNSGKEAFYDLVKVSDVVADNFRAGAINRIGADYETLRKINPRIISASIGGYGFSGPYSQHPSYDNIAAAVVGILDQTGYPGGKIVYPCPALVDYTAGLYLAAGILTAVYERERTGVGRRVEINMIDTGMALMKPAFHHLFFFGQPPPRQGATYLSIPLLGYFKCRNGYIALGSCWPKICKLINEEWMVNDPRFKDLESRILHKDELEEIVEDRLQQADVEDWMERLRAEGVECGPVNVCSKAVEDPQVIHNKVLVTLVHPEYGETKTFIWPIKIPGGLEGEYTPAPNLGENTDEVLKEVLGYSDEKIARLKKEQEANFETMQEHVRKEF